ncbi:MAG TPA: formate--tetrahydrofolate ligase [Bacilli bacterium]|nr:formate--tetrahydrofolate ligase [Bacilli bacterium]
MKNNQEILNVIKKLKLKNNEYSLYGNMIAKIDKKNINRKGKLVLVTSINPTPYGEGKTTLVIGINDSLNKLKKSSIAVLREPSLGPVFGIKGGATGGGYASIIPSDDINLHFTGDFHAITSANNLICSVIDNHIYQGNTLNIDKNRILFNRCLDLNDRALRDISLNNRKEKFNITAASEIMAILCLSENINELKENINNILIGYTKNNKEIYVRDLNCGDAATILLKDSIKPNLVQSLYHNPVLVHGGPFANIAHGCNSIISTKLGLSLADYTIVEAGFGADLGAEKFFDIKCRKDIKPDCVVINFTIRALKHNGYCPNNIINDENIEYITKGFINLKAHIENLNKFTKNIIVCLNKFQTDKTSEIKYVRNLLKDLGYEMQISNSYLEGENGSIELARNIIEACKKPNDFKYLYDLNDSIEDKISTICKEIYRANSIKFTENAINTINNINNLGYNNLPICIAKTQYSLSNDSKSLGLKENYEIVIDKLEVKTGARFIVVYLGNINTMPGLNKSPNLEKMHINNNEIEGVI